MSFPPTSPLFSSGELDTRIFPDNNGYIPTQTGLDLFEQLDGAVVYLGNPEGDINLRSVLINQKGESNERQ